jgi:hypothetical protein
MSSFADPKNTPRTTAMPASESTTGKDAPIKVDGFGQVIALLEVADASFRESLINRIAAKDPQLARQIRATLSRN